MDKNINIFTNNNNKEKGKTTLIVVLVVILALIHFCGKKPVDKKNPCEGVFVEERIEIDTIRKTYIDTISFYDSILVPFYVEVDVEVPFYDTIRNLNTYENIFEDSLLTGTIFSTVDGVLVNQKFNYTPKFPKYILKTDSIIITNDITNTVIINKRRFYVGMEVGGNVNSFSVSPIISFIDKRYNLFSYRYDAINKTHNLGYQKQLKFRK